MQSALIVVLAVLDAVLVTLSQLALWQRKEYRIDRLMAYVNSPEGSLAREYAAICSGAFLILAWVLFFFEQPAFAEYAALASMGAILVGHGIRISHKGVMRPDPTWRAILIAILIFFGGAVTISFLPFHYEFLALQIATLLFFLPVLIALCVLLVAIPAQLQKQRVIIRAKKYRQRLSSLKVVGITGSVGKTSTKTYLVHLLGGESSTVKATSEHRNSPYAVATDMLSRLTSTTTTYIAEMGAYKRGEIAELAQLTQPNIGIVTAITNQHAALFGSLAALAKTKWELVEALPKDGMAILNKADGQIVRQAKHLKKKIMWFSLEGSADVYASDIVLHADHTSCAIVLDGKTHTVKLPIISRGQLVPVLAAVTAAHVLGEVSKDLVARLKTLPALPRTMQRISGKKKTIIVDDSYSASEASVTNAIEYLSALPKGDIRLVVIPVMELGLEGHRVHERIGKLLSGTSWKTYIYGDSYKQDILRGLGKKSKTDIQWFDDPKKLSEALAQGMSENTTILLEGRVPALVREVLL